MGKKLHLECSEVNVNKVSQYKGLKVRDLNRLAESKLDIVKYLPEYSYNKEPNREWLCNIISTLVKDELKNLLKRRLIKEIKSWSIYRILQLMQSKNSFTFLSDLKPFPPCKENHISSQECQS